MNRDPDFDWDLECAVSDAVDNGDGRVMGHRIREALERAGFVITRVGTDPRISAVDSCDSPPLGAGLDADAPTEFSE